MEITDILENLVLDMLSNLNKENKNIDYFVGQYKGNIIIGESRNFNVLDIFEKSVEIVPIILVKYEETYNKIIIECRPGFEDVVGDILEKKGLEYEYNVYQHMSRFFVDKEEDLIKRMEDILNME